MAQQKRGPHDGSPATTGTRTQPPRQADAAAKAAAKKRKKRRVKRLVIAAICVLIAVPILLVTGIIVWLTSSLKTTDIPKDNSNLGINDRFDDKKYADITNIALFGVDRRGTGSSRSDAIMIITVDKRHHKLKAASLLRDSYVTIEGRSKKDKLTHAYAYGGATLAIKTINQNFGLNIRDYVTVDFDSMAKVVDAVGGVTIDVKQNELASANNSIKEYCKVYKIKNPTYIQKAGTQVLNGMQACGYSRVRYAGNGDDRQRTDRQRKVVEQVFNKVRDMNLTAYPGLAAQIVPLVETSMSLNDIVGLGTTLMKSGDAGFDQKRFPENADLRGETIGGVSYIVFDEAKTQQKIHDFIFEGVESDT